MQSETTDFAPSAATWRTSPDIQLVLPCGELDETYVSSLILAKSLHYVNT